VFLVDHLQNFQAPFSSLDSLKKFVKQNFASALSKFSGSGHLPQLMVREYISSTGVLIKVGENAKENDNLVKSSHQDFLWCHLENQPSPHAVIEDPSPDAQTIDEALQLVKYHSKARNCPQSRMIMCKIRELIRVDRTRPGLVRLKQAPTKKSIRTDPPALGRLGVPPGQ
jgi:hypothetical protein